MSEFEGEVRDNYREHSIHEKYDEQCSTCYSENRLIKAHKVVNHPIDSLSAITGIKLSDMLGK